MSAGTVMHAAQQPCSGRGKIVMNLQGKGRLA
jgi:hypothetical protein